MVTITLSESDAKHFENVRLLAEGAVLTDPNLNGAKIVVEVGDNTCVDGADELVGAALLARVKAICSGEG